MKELGLNEYLNLINPNFGVYKLFNLNNHKSEFVASNIIKNYSIPNVREKIGGMIRLTRWEQEQSIEYLQSLDPHLYSEDIGLSISACTYFGNKSIESNISSINLLAVDIDYRKDASIKVDAKTVAYSILPVLYENNLLPTFVEYGHNLRLIYQLNEPIKFTKASKKTKFIRMLKKSVKRLTDKVIELTELFAEPQQLNSFIRLPGSINEKDDLYDIHVIHSGDKVNLSFFTDFLDDDYVKPKRKKKKFKANKDMLGRRLDDLLSIVDIIDVGYRELYLHFIYQTMFAITGNMKESLAVALDANNNLSTPLEKRKAQTAICYNRLYFYKNQTIKAKLNLSDDFCNERFIFISNKNRNEYFSEYRRKQRDKKIKKGLTKQQVLYSNTQKAIAYRNDGLTIKEIAEKFSVSVRTIHRWLNKNKEVEEDIRDIVRKKDKKMSLAEIIKSGNDYFVNELVPNKKNDYIKFVKKCLTANPANFFDIKYRKTGKILHKILIPELEDVHKYHISCVKIINLNDKKISMDNIVVSYFFGDLIIFKM